MATGGDDCFPPIEPKLQISFYYRLQTLKDTYLEGAMRKTVSTLDVETINAELSTYVTTEALRRVASFGLRGEIFFAVPCVIRANPFLLGYYRLLLGLSQKETYQKSGLGRFMRLENTGLIGLGLDEAIPSLCKCLNGGMARLVSSIDELSLPVVHDLQLLTIGPQLRGSANTTVGQAATQEFYGILERLVSSYKTDSTPTSITLVNDSGRTVRIQLSSDPDVSIVEVLPTQERPLVSIEIKGGTDPSNIHNRLGEAEKSHLKARIRGFSEFWTVLRVDIGDAMRRSESPTTTRFFHLDYIKDVASEEHTSFNDLLRSVLSIHSIEPSDR